MEPIIRAKNLNFTYNKGKDNEFHALININLEIYPEEFVIIFGPSGCGKSTLLNVMAGLESPDSGNIVVFDKDLTEMTKNDFAYYHRSRVGMIYQAYNLITSLTVMDNVALPQIFVNVGKRKREKWSMSLLERFGISQHAKKIPTELSGGQQQRIGIARAIVNNPQIILADEPVGNLDSVSAENVLKILGELNEKEKKTIILVTHNPENLSYGDRIINMKDGIITREIVNREKKKIGEKKNILIKPPSEEIREIMRAYHGLSPDQINILIMPYKAKVFAHHFITSRNLEETKTFEDVIQRKLLGTISRDEFFDILNRSYAEGGVGFNSRTAGKITRRVSRLIKMAYYIHQKGRQRKNPLGEHDKIASDEKAIKITDYLLRTCYLEYYQSLKEEQIERLRGGVKERLESKIQKQDFYKLLDLPLAEGGVGLNSKTARAITDEFELIMILGFGIVQKTQAHVPAGSPKAAAGREGQPAAKAPVIEDAGISAEPLSASVPGKAGMVIPDSIDEKTKEESGEERKSPAPSPGFSVPPPVEVPIDAGRPPVKEKNDGQMKDEEIEMIIKEIAGSIDGVGIKDFGRVMGKAILRIGGKADYDRIAKAAKKVLLFKEVIGSAVGVKKGEE